MGTIALVCAAGCGSSTTAAPAPVLVDGTLTVDWTIDVPTNSFE